MKPITRIMKIEILNFKNIERGVIELPSFLEKEYFRNKNDLLGIYGQNGSGKTSVIEAMKIIKQAFAGKPLPEDTANYINIDAKQCKIIIQFSISYGEDKFLVDYLIELTRKDSDDFFISREKIDYTKMEEDKFQSKKILLDHSYKAEYPLLPKCKYKKIAADRENQINLEVASKISYRDKRSFIFDKDSRKLFNSLKNTELSDIPLIVNCLSFFAVANLFVITDSQSAVISINIMPVPFNENFDDLFEKGNFSIPIKNPFTIGKQQFDILNKIIPQMNYILEQIIPGMTIIVKDYGEEQLKSGQPGHRIEFLSKKEKREIPLRYESNGIIKLISILNVLLCIYHNPAICLFIDELDAGIFEYLLGEIGSILQEEAKGQIVFTSHNLRILEMLNKNSILFSTVNPKNRFIRVKGLKNSNNLRDFYYRAIRLEGQKETLYEPTDNVDIAFAFMKAEKECHNDKES